ncbi:hypothetical protein [Micromonospora maritima]|uniref:hypothetical protein n=1 Tax=Micromonospora maritima TaxID=986711 RepID=UPI00157D7834|nr:hypothetical protein [Micromonospora maritima]
MSVLTAEALRSNSVVAVHRRPEGAPWIPCCDRCTEEGCPALDEALAHLRDVARRPLVSGAAFHGRR